MDDTMLIMSGLMFLFAALVIGTVGSVLYKSIVKKQTVEHYYTPLDRAFGQTSVEHHEEKIEKKESEDEASDDKDKNARKSSF
jgi:uncharacterized membrane-anchored protein YitT (DUF2179 family)